MIQEIWLYPPLAFARLGNSDQPLESFYWGPNDVSPKGTGKTTIHPAKSIIVDEEGYARPYLPTHISLKDKYGRLKPVCPFFELHGRWISADGKVNEGQITERILSSVSKQSVSLSWRVEVANLKPYFMTQDEDNLIYAQVEMTGNDYGVKELLGRSPDGAKHPLIPAGKQISLGMIQLIRPNDDFPGLRLRFYPPRGNIYAPTNFETRDFGEEKYKIEEDFLLLNAASSWPKWTPSATDLRGVPGFQFARDVNDVSLGLVDDTSDGIISCSLAGTNLTAQARIVVTPPHYAPDRRHIVSIADGLKDRVARVEVNDSSYFSETEKTFRVSANHQGEILKREITRREMANLEVYDLIERAFETMGLSNLDAFNDRVDTMENPTIALVTGKPYKEGEHKAFMPEPPTNLYPLPIVEQGRQRHRRFSSLEFFENLLRQRPSIIEELIRPPVGDNPFFDKKMPALMIGSSGEPLHLTRRQYNLLVTWARLLRVIVKEGS